MEGEEVLADVDEGEPAEPSDRGGNWTEQAERQEGGKNKSGGGNEVEGGVGGAKDPGKGGQGPECGSGAEGFRGAFRLSGCGLFVTRDPPGRDAYPYASMR